MRNAIHKKLSMLQSELLFPAHIRHVYLIRREEKGFEVGGWLVRLDQIQSVSTTEAKQKADGEEAKMAALHIVYLVR